MLEENIQNGNAIKKLKEFLSAQGGDASVVDQPDALPQAAHKFELEAKESGYVENMVADEIGHAAMMLGAGRQTKESEIDLAVGIVLNKKVGDYVEKGESILTIHANQTDVDEIKEKLYNNISINSSEVQAPQLVHQLISQ